MAKKRANPVQAVQEPRTAKAVRLDLSPEDHNRLEKSAKKRGLSKAACARMVVLQWLDNEGERKP